MITSLELDCNSGLELGIQLNSVLLPLCVGSLRLMDLGLSIDRFKADLILRRDGDGSSMADIDVDDGGT